MSKFVHTKIVCTIGPATNSEDKIRELFAAGVDVFRLNTSHGDKDSHSKAIRLIRKVELELGVCVAILLDLQGPKIRVGTLPQVLNLKEGATVSLIAGDYSKEEGVLPINHSKLLTDVLVGHRIQINDGRITLRVKSKLENSLEVVVVDGGEVESRKGVNIPEATLTVDVLSDRDRHYIKFGIEQEVDYFALSFVRTAEDLKETLDVIRQFGGDIPIIAKIEKPQAIENIEAILDASDGIMVARGDLGIELAPEKVPMAQKRLVKLANLKKKAVIVATQMLESMIKEPLPTRAEANDVANAIIDGTDAVMLSGETTVGKYPIRAVKMMNDISINVEESDFYKELHRVYGASDIDKADPNANDLMITRMLSETNIKAIIVMTRTGYTAQILSKAKIEAPIIACTQSLKICRQLVLLSGVLTQQLEIPETITDQFIDKTIQELKCRNLYGTGDLVACIAGLPFFSENQSTTIRIKTVN